MIWVCKSCKTRLTSITKNQTVYSRPSGMKQLKNKSMKLSRHHHHQIKRETQILAVANKLKLQKEPDAHFIQGIQTALEELERTPDLIMKMPGGGAVSYVTLSQGWKKCLDDSQIKSLWTEVEAAYSFYCSDNETTEEETDQMSKQGKMSGHVSSRRKCQKNKRSV